MQSVNKPIKKGHNYSWEYTRTVQAGGKCRTYCSGLLPSFHIMFKFVVVRQRLEPQRGRKQQQQHQTDPAAKC